MSSRPQIFYSLDGQTFRPAPEGLSVSYRLQVPDPSGGEHEMSLDFRFTAEGLITDLWDEGECRGTDSQLALDLVEQLIQTQRRLGAATQPISDEDEPPPVREAGYRYLTFSYEFDDLPFRIPRGAEIWIPGQLRWSKTSLGGGTCGQPIGGDLVDHQTLEDWEDCTIRWPEPEEREDES